VNENMKYQFDLKDRTDLERIQSLLEYWCSIMEMQNEDSNESIRGGAGVHYEVEIKFKEVWI